MSFFFYLGPISVFMQQGIISPRSRPVSENKCWHNACRRPCRHHRQIMPVMMTFSQLLSGQRVDATLEWNDFSTRLLRKKTHRAELAHLFEGEMRMSSIPTHGGRANGMSLATWTNHLLRVSLVQRVLEDQLTWCDFWLSLLSLRFFVTLWIENIMFSKSSFFQICFHDLVWPVYYTDSMIFELVVSRHLLN